MTRAMRTDPAIEPIRAGDPRAIARAISAIEDREAGSEKLLQALFPFTGNGYLIGITGAPGGGKSSLADKLAATYREQQKRVGIIAVDPTSPFTGGALLGDRIRMQKHATDAGIYIRSMATRGFLGGVARAAADAALVLDAAGKEIVLIETVGVGQDEVEIVKLADATVLVLVPGMGDEVQTFKAGIMEIADVFVINKVDRGGTEKLEHELKLLLGLSTRTDGWQPPIIKTVATEGTGVAELTQAVAEYRSHLERRGLEQEKRVERWQQRLLALLRERTLAQIVSTGIGEDKLAGYADQVARRERDPYSIVDEMLRTAGIL
ncbi:MAG: methylmalonyl Co-A mutase-associated GTPase MeaB [Terriglobia bacterium]